MPVTFTAEQQEVINLRDCSILVSAAAGSGKTAVLVERIVKMVCDEEKSFLQNNYNAKKLIGFLFRNLPHSLQCLFPPQTFQLPLLTARQGSRMRPWRQRQRSIRTGRFFPRRFCITILMILPWSHRWLRQTGKKAHRHPAGSSPSSAASAGSAPFW